MAINVISALVLEAHRIHAAIRVVAFVKVLCEVHHFAGGGIDLLASGSGSGSGSGLGLDTDVDIGSGLGEF